MIVAFTRSLADTQYYNQGVDACSDTYHPFSFINHGLLFHCHLQASWSCYCCWLLMIVFTFLPFLTTCFLPSLAIEQGSNVETRHTTTTPLFTSTAGCLGNDLLYVMAKMLLLSAWIAPWSTTCFPSQTFLFLLFHSRQLLFTFDIADTSWQRDWLWSCSLVSKRRDTFQATTAFHQLIVLPLILWMDTLAPADCNDGEYHGLKIYKVYLYFSCSKGSFYPLAFPMILFPYHPFLSHQFPFHHCIQSKFNTKKRLSCDKCCATLCADSDLLNRS